jgi:hypothetical protein
MDLTAQMPMDAQMLMDAQIPMLEQVNALKQSFTIKSENYRYKPIRFVCYNDIIIGQIIEIFTVEFVYYYAPTMIRLFPIFEAKYFPESLNFYVYKSSPTNDLTCEQLNSMLYELERHKQTARRTLKKYTKKMN